MINHKVKHSILLVDDSRNSLKVIGRMPQKSWSIELTDSGMQALEMMNVQENPFSVTIADQRLKDMTGIRFLERVKKISSDTQRLLLADFSDIESIVQAVNKGTIQGYISKPLQIDPLMKGIEQGIELSERHFENERLMRLAKKQNHKLYELDCELMEKTKLHTKKYQSLETEIEILKDAVKTLKTDENSIDHLSMNLILKIAGNPDKFNKESAEPLLNRSIQFLHKEFADLAAKHGFEMPLPKDNPPC